MKSLRIGVGTIMEELSNNIWKEKLNIALAINEIGPNRIIKLFFDKDGQFMVSSGKMDYYPTDQGKIKDWVHETSLKVDKKDAVGNWAKYAAEDMLCEIEKSIKRRGLRIV